MEELFAYYQNSLASALLDLFPEIGLNKTKFAFSNFHHPPPLLKIIIIKIEKKAKEGMW